MQLTKLAAVCSIALLLAGCLTSQQASAPASTLGSTRQVLGTEILGAQGKTLNDQVKIDQTVAGPCATGIYTKSECARHSAASRERFGELR